MVQFPMTLNDP